LLVILFLSTQLNEGGIGLATAKPKKKPSKTAKKKVTKNRKLHTKPSNDRPDLRGQTLGRH